MNLKPVRYFFILSFYTAVFSSNIVTTNKSAIQILKKSIASHGLYTNRMKNECMVYAVASTTKEYFEIQVRERHNDSCGGDPETEPLLDVFRVIRINGSVLIYDVIEDTFKPIRSSHAAK